MKFLYQFGIGLGLALASSLLVFGALLMASAEGVSQQPPTPEPTETVASVEPGIDTPTPRPTETPVPPINCPPPSDWVMYTITGDDTLESIAQAAHVSVQDLMTANCLISTALRPDSDLYIPPPPLTPTNTRVPPTSAPANPEEPTSTKAKATPQVCQNPPSGWVHYVIKQHDTLYNLSQTFGVSMSQLQSVNCIADPDNIRYGMIIFVPNTNPSPTRTNVPAPTDTKKPASTRTPVPTNTPTLTPTFTFTAQPTFTDTPTPTFTALPTHTPTLTPTVTDTPGS
jgi:LysM repeat protein